MERLESFGLPPMFEASMMPEAGARFVSECPKGIDRETLLRLASDRGFMPTWKRLDHLGPGVFGLGLTIGGCGVPLMVRMTAGEQQEVVVSTAAEQLSLF
jgi:hypothetical protein